MARQTKAKTSEPAAESTSRIKTRPRNATVHPGKVVLEGGRSRRSKEEVQQDKELKQARKEAEERKKIQAETWREAGKVYIEQLEADEAAAAKTNDFPRHRRGTLVHSYQTGS